MRRDTFAETLRRLNRAAPFRRYTIELLNGARMIAYHPEIIVMEGDLVIYEEDPDVTTYFDATCVAQVVDVVIPHGAE